MIHLMNGTRFIWFRQIFLLSKTNRSTWSKERRTRRSSWILQRFVQGSIILLNPWIFSSKKTKRRTGFLLLLQISCHSRLININQWKISFEQKKKKKTYTKLLCWHWSRIFISYWFSYGTQKINETGTDLKKTKKNFISINSRQDKHKIENRSDDAVHVLFSYWIQSDTNRWDSK